MKKTKNEILEQSVKKDKISMKISKRIGMTTCIIFVIVAVVIAILVKVQIDNSNETELTLESQSAANELNTFFQKYVRTVENLSINPEVLTAVNSSDKNHRLSELDGWDSVFQYLVNMQKYDSENIMAVWIASIASNEVVISDGYISGSDFEITSREWYSVSQSKQSMLTKPYIDVSTGNLVVTAATPIINSSTGKVIGITGIDLQLTQVNKVLSQFKIGETGYVGMTYKDGTIMYHPSSENIQKNLSDINLSDDIINLVASESNGFVKYSYGGSGRYGYVYAIDDTGYVVFSSISASEYSESLIRMIVIMVIIFVIGTVIIFISIRKSAANITKPIEDLDVAAKELAEGNLNVQLKITTNDEIGDLGRSIQQTVSRLKVYIAYIDEVSNVLDNMAKGTLAISLKQEYTGDFRKIKDSLVNISSSLTEMITGISESSNQVSAGADDLAKASQTLAEGATLQAASVEQLVATADNILSELQISRDDALDCASESKKVNVLADNSKTQMKDMLEAMNKINETSNQVVGIIHTIEEIADQTNLLALNASIEAARAGDAGKGFAVVASEIGTLATQSAEAAANTKKLIGISIDEIKKGVTLANQVTDILETVVSGIDNVSTMVTHTADLSVQQEENMKQMQSGIDSIAQAVQDTSATAEESSATSEELAAQASVLAELIKKFKL